MLSGFGTGLGGLSQRRGGVAAPAPDSPVNTSSPVVSGTATEGETLTTTDGTWTGAATITFTYQWYRATTDGGGEVLTDENGDPLGVAISGATGATYVLTPDDVSEQIFCIVTGTNGSGSADGHSNVVGPIAAIPSAGWSVVGTSEQALAGAGGPTAITLPGTPQEGDVVIVVLGCDTAMASNRVSTSGYTQEMSDFGLQVHTKQLGATPDSTVTVAHDGSAVTGAIVRLYRGAISGTYKDATTTTISSASNTNSPNPPAITTVTDGCLIIPIAFLDDQVITDVTAPTGYSNLEWFYNGAGVNLSATVMIADKEQTTAGIEDPDPFVCTGGNDIWAACTIALRPA